MRSSCAKIIGDQDGPPSLGLSIMPGEYVRRSRRWAERRYTDLVFFNEVARGGHFAMLEQPELLVDDVRATFRGLR